MNNIDISREISIFHGRQAFSGVIKYSFLTNDEYDVIREDYILSTFFKRPFSK